MRLPASCAAAGLLLVTACAHAPPRHDLQPPTAAAPVAAPGIATASHRNPYPGYRMKQRNGTTVWCKKLARLGTRFEDEYCMNEAQMKQLEAKGAEDREHFRRNQAMCGIGICGDDG